MKYKMCVLGAAALLVACSQSKESEKVAPPGETGVAADGASASQAAGSDPCALVANAEAILGQPVTADHNTNPNNTVDCQWKAADGRLCGSLSVFGPGYNDVADAKTNYGALTTSLGAFGQTWDVAGVGEEAKAVDGGMLGAQLAFRKGKHAVLVGSACKSGVDGPPVLTERLAREVAGHL